MADRLRRQKDIIKNTVTSYLSSTTKDYSKYFEGSPTFITFYQIDSAASLQDVGLETTNSLVGSNTGHKYNRISEVPVWGVDALDVSNEINERGLQSIVNGELLFLPDSVRPYPGDFFVFEYNGMEEHLFKINDAQFDRISPKKYFRVQFSLYQSNANEILDNIADDYICEYNTDGNSDSIKIVKKSEAAEVEASKKLVDKIIKKYETLFYNDDMDTFVSRDHLAFNEYFWSPYVQHFLHETKVLDTYESEILSEIYVMDINEIDNEIIYNEEAYRNSLFRNIEIQNNNVTFDQNFLCIVNNYNLKQNRNLPFFMSPLSFKLVTPIVKSADSDIGAYTDSFPIFLTAKTGMFKDVPHNFKLVNFSDAAELAAHDAEIPFKEGDVLYECPVIETVPDKIGYVTEVTDSTIGETSLELVDAGIVYMLSNSTPVTEGFEIFNNIIKPYLNNTFELTEDIITFLDNYYYKENVENYILMPIIIYILKQYLNS